MDTDNYPAGTIIDGRYRIEGKLGRGGFATVYRAEHLQLGRPAALKVLEPVAPQITERFQARFNTEARIAANLDHPSVVRIFDFGFISPDDRPYMAMELLDGCDLEEYLREHGSMEPERAKRLFLPVLDALRLGHERGIVHKDLKPSNLYLVKEGTPEERLVVLDYGIARLEGDENPRYTEEGTYTGTPAYMPPEYINRREVTPAYDVYQIGLIFIETMTGQPVIRAATAIACMVAHVEGKHRIPDGFADTPLGATLVRAISVDPAERYGHAGAMFEAIEFADVEHGTDFTLPSITLDEAELKRVTDADAKTNTTETRLDGRPRSGISIPVLIAILVVTGGLGCLLFTALVAGALLVAPSTDDKYVEDYFESPIADEFMSPKVPLVPIIGEYPPAGQKMYAWLLARHMILTTLSQVTMYDNLLAKGAGWSKEGASFVPTGTGDLLSLAHAQIAIGLNSPPNHKNVEKLARAMQSDLVVFDETLTALYDYHSVTRGWESDGGAQGKQLTKQLTGVTERFRPQFVRWSEQVDNALRTHLKNRSDELSDDPFLAAATDTMLTEHKLVVEMAADPMSRGTNTALSKFDKALDQLSKRIRADRAGLVERYKITSGLHDRFLGSLKDTRKQAAEIRSEARAGDNVSNDIVFLWMQLHMTFDVYNQLQRYQAN